MTLKLHDGHFTRTASLKARRVYPIQEAWTVNSTDSKSNLDSRCSLKSGAMAETKENDAGSLLRAPS